MMHAIATTILTLALSGRPAMPIQDAAPTAPAAAARNPRPTIPTQNQPDRANHKLVIYDARDIEATFQPTGPVMGRGAFGSLSNLLVWTARNFEADCQPVGEGVYVVTGPEDAHVHMQSLLHSLRQMRGDTHEMELTAHQVPADFAPRTGSQLGDIKPLKSTTIKQAVRNGGSADMSALTTRSYIAGWEPVVGNNAVGYDPQVEEVSSGLRVQVNLGIGPTPGKSVELRMRGTLTSATITDVQASSPDGKTGPLTIGLPVVESREFTAELTLPVGQSIVAAVVPGLEPNTSMVIAVTVR